MKQCLLARPNLASTEYVRLYSKCHSPRWPLALWNTLSASSLVTVIQVRTNDVHDSQKQRSIERDNNLDILLHSGAQDKNRVTKLLTAMIASCRATLVLCHLIAGGCLAKTCVYSSLCFCSIIKSFGLLNCRISTIVIETSGYRRK